MAIEKKTLEFFEKLDTDNNECIILDEFTSFNKEDKDDRDCLISYIIVIVEDLGLDIATVEEPFYDSDLENEVAVPESFQEEKRAGAKYGIDFEVELRDDGSFCEKERPQATAKAAPVEPWKRTV